MGKKHNNNQKYPLKQNGYSFFAPSTSNTYVYPPNFGVSPFPQQTYQSNHNHTVTSSEWYQQRQKVSYWQQRPCVILLEFCQLHKLPDPQYVLRSNDEKVYWFDCIIGERVFTPNYSCNKCLLQNDAIDYISTQAFNRLFNEYKQTTVSIKSTSSTSSTDKTKKN